MPRKTRRKRALFYFALVGALLIGCVVAINHGNHWRAVWTGSFAMAAACWIVALRFPVRCGATTRQGLSCRNAANGVLFGCSQAGHTWIKFKAHFGRTEPVRARATTRSSTGSSSEAQPQPAAESKRSTVLFWLTVIATCSGTISMTTDVAGLFN